MLDLDCAGRGRFNRRDVRSLRTPDGSNRY
jgi:hypothetical protein